VPPLRGSWNLLQIRIPTLKGGANDRCANGARACSVSCSLTLAARNKDAARMGHPESEVWLILPECGLPASDVLLVGA